MHEHTHTRTERDKVVISMLFKKDNYHDYFAQNLLDLEIIEEEILILWYFFLKKKSE